MADKFSSRYVYAKAGTVERAIRAGIYDDPELGTRDVVTLGVNVSDRLFSVYADLCHGLTKGEAAEWAEMARHVFDGRFDTRYPTDSVEVPLASFMPLMDWILEHPGAGHVHWTQIVDGIRKITELIAKGAA